MGSTRNSWRETRAAVAVEKAAGDWLAKRDRGLSAAEAVAFTDWKSADPRHAAELARLDATWSALDTADEVPEIMAISREVDDRLERRDQKGRRSWWLVGALAAASVALVVTRTDWLPVPTANSAVVIAPSPTYRIVPGQAQQLTLADGTIVELNADSAVEPAFTLQERRVRLVRGEAHFAVVRDAARPFVVQAGDVAIRAVGTAFDVRIGPAGVQLLVTEGKVRVDAAIAGLPASPATPLVVAGERLVVTAGNRASDLAALRPETLAPDEIERSLAWKRPQLIFERTPLAEAVKAFNRFNRGKLVIADPALAGRILGGTFQADNVEAFVHLLEAGFDVAAERRGDSETILRQRR